MPNIEIIRCKTKQYTIHQNLSDFFAILIFTCATIIISIAVALFLLKSPWYGLLGIIPLLFFRPRDLIYRARELEEKIGLKGEIVNSLQLSRIPKDSKENYSQELIQAFIDEAATRIEKIDTRRFVDRGSLALAARFVLIAVAFALIQPAVFPERFWYSLNHRIEYNVSPGSVDYPKDTQADVALQIWGVYLPKIVNLRLSAGEETTRQTVSVQDNIARSTVTVSEPLIYHFEVFEHKTRKYELYPVEPLYIENLFFHLRYPAHTKLAEETRTGRQLVVPEKTVVYVQGRASELLQAANLDFGDTLALTHEGREFHGEFVVTASGTATLHLRARGELHEGIRIYAIPDLAPLVDIFYPGTNVNLPYDMKLDVGIRCSDDYGLSAGTFHFAFEIDTTKLVALKRGAFEDTVYILWDLSDLGMLPGDEVSYYVTIRDNSGQVTKSNTYYVYFPTMEQMYEAINEQEAMLEIDIEDMHTEHGEHIKEVARIQEKLMKERELSWADQEKLSEAIKEEEVILEQINQWQTELEETIEKLNEGIILDQKSIDRLNEISQILEELAPEELREALENLRVAMEQRPGDMQKALEQMRQHQEELAKALERSLEILKRYEQEEKLRQIAERAKELAEQQVQIEELTEAEDGLAAENQQEVDQGMEELIDKLNELAASEGLEEEIREALRQMANEMQNLKSGSGKDKKTGLQNLAMNLEQLYEKLTQGRFANLRKNLLESLKQIIETSEAQEKLINDGLKIDPDLQGKLIQATETIAESLFAQQTKSLFVSPEFGKGLARATLRMEQAQKYHDNAKVGKLRATEAMRELNLVARDILFILARMKQDGSSTGINSFMQQLGDITNSQMSLNQALMGILPIPMQGLSQGQKKQLQRLAARQRALREALESLRNEAAAGRYQDVLGDVIREMQEMEEDLFQYKVSRELIERQKKVISRLLDSQRSIRKEDFAKKRKSKPGQDVRERASPAPLAQELGEDELRELLQQELRKPYPEEYEIYIREYFRALLEEQ
ncbi:hypothetical protein AMJ83_08240 [candidate division WOR_3 bacterium SM23_42]|uniref:DUF4175 domain-containing protein n=1 Tax=candidate division WOR_3 bacterium SM23_42 TaxID=1703779 RepID=A0A0S8FQZ7_UNCW3|nr:MAG: hypothetical protein AMJ83_08240 [candidate division WOR_3 bacterium SM23_42]